jgi:hypothetical protein
MSSISSSSSSSASSMAASSSSVPTNPFPLPLADASKEVWQKFIKDSTERVDGVDPEAAQLICLGDIHTAKWQKAWREVVADHFGSTGDILLIEGWDAERSMPPLWAKIFLNTTKKFDVYGWDDMAIQKATNAPTKTMVDLVDKYNKSPGSDWSKEDITAFNEASEQVEAHSKSRTYTMIKTARSFLKKVKPGQKIFLIAGSRHLFDTDGFNIVNAMSTVKITSLLPKRPVITDEEALAYSKKLLEG